ncbi:uncharacterized protein [Hemitrygon akajei]|uniref:uncharacterized protein n=1 Tax=Hemitrygon akajei TaxID=2704970 RepID=UPI003BF9743B
MAQENNITSSNQATADGGVADFQTSKFLLRAKSDRFVTLPITSDGDLKTLWDQYQEINRNRCQYRLNVHELHSDVESRITANSLLGLCQTTCLKNAYALKKNLSISESKFFCQLLSSRNAAHLVFPGVGLTPLSKQASSDNGRFSFLSSETQRILDRMDDSEIYVNVKFTKTGSETPSRGPHKQEPNENIGNRPDRKIWLLCLVTLILFVTVVGLSIHVSQIPQSMFTSDRNCHEVNSTCQSTISKNSHMDLSQRTCLNNLSALSSNLSDVKRMHSDLRHQFTKMETKYRSVNETKAQICELLTSRREQPFSQEWIRNEDGCYFISTFNYSYNEAKQYCLNTDSKLLEINSAQEQIFFSKTIRDQGISYWIGKCKDG